jgi:hypothetical protein
MVAVWTGDITFGLGRHLTLEIGITPKATTRKRSITLKRRMLDREMCIEH